MVRVRFHRRARKGGASAPTTFDAADIDDPLAGRIEWTPAARGGANFRTRRLKHVRPGRLEFRPTATMVVFSLVFFIVGLALLAAGPWYWIGPGQDADTEGHPVVLLLAGSVFAAAGGALLWQSLYGPVFDRLTGIYWKGRKPSPGAAVSGKSWCRLNQVHAIQVLEEWIVSKGERTTSRYWSYELNLVLESGQRIVVVDHAGIEAVRADALTLGRIFGWPVWDGAVNAPTPQVSSG